LEEIAGTAVYIAFPGFESGVHMSTALSLVVPVIISVVALFALHKKVDVYGALTAGALEGLQVILKILPALVGLLTAVYMLRASGALDALAALCAPVLTKLGIPPETASLIFIRPVSGSGALAVGSELITKYGADSQIGRTVAVMLGSTETTFYTIAVYFGAVGIKKTRYAIPAALSADLTSFIVASLVVRLLFS
jgi:spore maturation protein B